MNSALADRIDRLIDQISTIIVGKRPQIEDCIACLLAGGHLLIEDVPGVGKTTLAHALAVSLGLRFSRCQFTADLMPSDLIGVSVYERSKEAFVFHQGPVFAQVLLADEINRAGPKTQSALLEAMEEHQVSVEGATRALPEPFPADQSSQGSGDAPFPTLPTLRTTVSWQDPLSEPADVWVFLSVYDCPLMGLCDFSRSLRGTAEAGATSIELVHDQIHAGAYQGNAVLDRDRNLESTLFPGNGDAVTLPNQAVEIAAVGESSVELFTLIEL